MTTATDSNPFGAAEPSAAHFAQAQSPAAAAARELPLGQKSAQRVAFQPSGTLLSPTAGFAWLLGLLGVAACVAPRLAHGWLWLDLIAAAARLCGLRAARHAQ